MPEMDPIFNKNMSVSLCFFCWFFDESRGVFFFCGLVAKVLQTETTSGHFCSYITPKLESWTLCFARAKHYFFVFAGAGSEHLGQLFPTFWLVCILGHDFTILLRNWGSSRSSKDDFLWEFQCKMLRWFFVNFRGRPKSHMHQRLNVIYAVLEHLSNRLLTSESRHSSSSYMADGYW